tara:strand:+ start:6088 stop:6846 length:759 start_codon:yes stop_codon:yes gene_type:complete
MQFASLGSGSKGNATLVRAGGTLVMIDCGFSVRETTRRMRRLGVQAEDLDAILVTHEHSDHASGVAALSRRFAVPVYLTHGTHATGRLDGGHAYCRFNSEHSFSIGELAVCAVPVPHDAAEPCQFRFNWRHCSLGLLTDLGSITPHIVDMYGSCRSLLLEFNHDLPMLLAGDYPAALKRRVGGDWGHLNNEQAVDLLRQLGGSRLDHLVVAHVSEKNNRRELAERALLSVLKSLDGVTFAQQGEGFDWLQLD